MKLLVPVVVLLSLAGSLAQRAPSQAPAPAPIRGALRAPGPRAGSYPRSAASTTTPFRGATLPAGCDCRDISTTFNPVCGADLATYGNPCVIACANKPQSSAGICPLCAVQSDTCNCNGQPYEPVCGFGYTWINPCDAKCGAYTCYTEGVCEYVPGKTFEATPPGNAAAGGVAAAAANTALPAAGSARYNYGEALHYSFIFYETMRSGVLPRHRVAWRGDSCQNCRGPNGEDVSGGYLEAGGSFLKLGLVEAFIGTNLAFGAYMFKDGLDKVQETGEAIDAIKWAADYIMSVKGPGRIIGVVGNYTLDFDYYGPFEEYSEWVSDYPSCYFTSEEGKRGTEIFAESAAALASAYVVLGASDPKRAGYLAAAQELYAFAKQYPGSYQNATDPCLKQHAILYPSSGYIDELAWAAAWLYAATGTASYLADARTYYNQLPAYAGYSFETGQKQPALHVLLYKLDTANAATYAAKAQEFFGQYLTQTIPHTQRGLAYPYHWGAARPAMNTAFLAVAHSKNLRATGGDAAYAARLLNYAAFQVNYILGDSGRSWLVGFGNNYPTYLWHKPSYNSYIDYPLRGIVVYTNVSKIQPSGAIETHLYQEASALEMGGSFNPQKFIAYGALYAAPLPDDSLIFGRYDFTYAEPTTDGNGGLTGALAGLAEYFDGQTHKDDCGLDLGWSHPNVVITSKSVTNLGASCGTAAVSNSG